MLKYTHKTFWCEVHKEGSSERMRWNLPSAGRGVICKNPPGNLKHVEIRNIYKFNLSDVVIYIQEFLNLRLLEDPRCSSLQCSLGSSAGNWKEIQLQSVRCSYIQEFLNLRLLEDPRAGRCSSLQCSSRSSAIPTPTTLNSCCWILIKFVACLYGITEKTPTNERGEPTARYRRSGGEFEKYLVEVQDFRKITDHFNGSWRIHLELIKKNRKMSTCNRLDFEALGSRPIMPKNLPGPSGGCISQGQGPWPNKKHIYLALCHSC